MQIMELYQHVRRPTSQQAMPCGIESTVTGQDAVQLVAAQHAVRGPMGTDSNLSRNGLNRSVCVPVWPPCRNDFATTLLYRKWKARSACTP